MEMQPKDTIRTPTRRMGAAQQARRGLGCLDIRANPLQVNVSWYIGIILPKTLLWDALSQVDKVAFSKIRQRLEGEQLW